MKPPPARFPVLDRHHFALLARSWPAVRENLTRTGFRHLVVVLEGAEPIRFEGDRLLLWFPERTTVTLFEHRREAFEPALAQAIFVVTGLHCGIQPTTGAG